MKKRIKEKCLYCKKEFKLLASHLKRSGHKKMHFHLLKTAQLRAETAATQTTTYEHKDGQGVVNGTINIPTSLIDAERRYNDGFQKGMLNVMDFVTNLLRRIG